MRRHILMPLLLLLEVGCFEDAAQVAASNTTETSTGADTDASSTTGTGTGTTDASSTTGTGTGTTDASSTTGTGTGTTDTPEPALEWTFNGSLESTGRIAGTLVLPEASYVPSGVNDLALRMDGSSPAISESAGQIVRDSYRALTIVTRFTLSDTSLSSAVFTIGGATEQESDNNMILQYVDGELVLSTEFASGTNNDAFLGNVCAPGIPCLIAVVLREGRGDLFVDGFFVRAFDIGAWTGMNPRITVGSWVSGSKPLIGELDHLSFYDAALADEQVALVSSAVP
jgi:hypothetical protein